MRPPFSRATFLKAGVILAAWTAYGVFSAWQAHYWYAFSKMPMSWADAYRYELTYSGLFAVATPLVLWLSRHRRLERGVWHRNAWLHFSLMLVVVPAIKMAFDAITRPPNSPFLNFKWSLLLRSVEYNFDTGALLYAVIVLVDHSVAYYRRYQTGLIAASRLQTQLVQAQLQALRMQLHPHFLFNALHSIAAMVHEDPDAAERTIARLSELLRLFLASSAVHEVSLDEELRVLELYLDIERVRFEDRLQVRYDVPAALRDATVPSLVLQPLVENSIRHGLGRRAEQGWLSIAAEIFGETLVLRVTDNGAGFPEGSPEGMGLGITRGRLESLYGPRQSLLLRNLPSGGAEARITLPLRLEQDVMSSGDHVELQSINR